jgi:hypothetical protein
MPTIRPSGTPSSLSMSALAIIRSLRRRVLLPSLDIHTKHQEPQRQQAFANDSKIRNPGEEQTTSEAGVFFTFT